MKRRNLKGDTVNNNQDGVNNNINIDDDNNVARVDDRNRIANNLLHHAINNSNIIPTPRTISPHLQQHQQQQQKKESYASGYSTFLNPDSPLLKSVGQKSDWELSLASVRESVTLLKNVGSLLPLPIDADIILTGPTADSLVYQSGTAVLVILNIISISISNI